MELIRLSITWLVMFTFMYLAISIQYLPPGWSPGSSQTLGRSGSWPTGTSCCAIIERCMVMVIWNMPKPVLRSDPGTNVANTFVAWLCGEICHWNWWKGNEVNIKEYRAYQCYEQRKTGKEVKEEVTIEEPDLTKMKRIFWEYWILSLSSNCNTGAKKTQTYSWSPSGRTSSCWWNSYS